MYSGGIEKVTTKETKGKLCGWWWWRIISGYSKDHQYLYHGHNGCKKSQCHDFWVQLVKASESKLKELMKIKSDDKYDE